MTASEGDAVAARDVAWLPAASESHVELLEREMRAAARVVTGCPVSTPRDPLMAEAGMVPVRTRREVLAARLAWTAASQREDDPLRAVATNTAPRRLRTTTGWRDAGRGAAARAGVPETLVEERLHITLPPWTENPRVTIRMDVDADVRRTAHDDVRRAAAERHLATLPDRAIWIWSDGSAEGGVSAGGGGALITLPSGEEKKIRTPAGSVCSSTRAELVAMRATLEEVQQLGDDLDETPLILCTDSQAALATLATGAGAQKSALGAAIWRLLTSASGGRQVHLQWVPRPIVGFPAMKERTSWPRRPPASHRIESLWTSAASPRQSAAPPPRPGGSSGRTAYSGGSWEAGPRSRFSPKNGRTPSMYISCERGTGASQTATCTGSAASRPQTASSAATSRARRRSAAYVEKSQTRRST